MARRAGRWILLLAIATLGWACKNQGADIEELLSRLNTEAEAAQDVEILYSDSAQVRVRVTGPVMLNYLDPVEPRQEFSEGVLVEFYGPQQRVSSQMVANFAVRYERRGEIIARDSVVWTSDKQEKLETEELIWDERRKEVYTQKFAVITTPREIIYGHGFTANQDFSDARIHQVEGIITVDTPEAGAKPTPVPSPASREPVVRGN